MMTAALCESELAGCFTTLTLSLSRERASCLLAERGARALLSVFASCGTGDFWGMAIEWFNPHSPNKNFRTKFLEGTGQTGTG